MKSSRSKASTMETAWGRRAARRLLISSSNAFISLADKAPHCKDINSGEREIFRKVYTFGHTEVKSKDFLEPTICLAKVI